MGERLGFSLEGDKNTIVWPCMGHENGTASMSFTVHDFNDHRFRCDALALLKNDTQSIASKITWVIIFGLRARTTRQETSSSHGHGWKDDVARTTIGI